MKKFLLTIITAAVLSAALIPDFAMAQSASINVGQTVCGVEPCGAPGGGGSSNPSDTSSPSIFDVSVRATFNSATISWSTNEISLGKVSWGKSTDYGDGEISKEQYSKAHTADILNLLPQTQYFFKILAFDQAGNDRVYIGKFLTLLEPDSVPPANVSQFVVKAAQDRMILSWKNPTDSDFDNVRIVRSEWFYPLDPFNGEVVFEGQGEYVTDGIVIPGRTYYYSVFTRDYGGNYSTGALGIGMILWFSEIPQTQYPDAPVVDIAFPSAPGEVTNPASFNDFTIIYNNGGATVQPDNPQIPSNTDIKLVIPEGKLPEGTTALTITVKDQNNGEGEVTYLFAYDKIAKEFFVTVPALVVQEAYRLIITVFNGAKQVLQTIAGSLQIIRNSANDIVIQSSAESTNNAIIIAILLSFIIIVVLYLLRFINSWQYTGFREPDMDKKSTRPIKIAKRAPLAKKKKSSEDK